MNYIFLFYFFALSSAIDLTCPQSAITINTPEGGFPADGISFFPANYTCKIQVINHQLQDANRILQFIIPDGQVVRIDVQTNTRYYSADAIAGIDMTRNYYRLSSDEPVFFAPANNATVQIKTVFNISTFYFTWKYTDVTSLKTVQKSTGSIISMNFDKDTAYIFTSSSSQVAFHIANYLWLPNGMTSKLYVYDGPNAASKFLGNYDMYQYNNNHSTGSSLTIVNFYGSRVESYGIANDWSALSSYEGYSFVLLSSTPNNYLDTTSFGRKTALTFYTNTSQECSILELAFLHPNRTGHSVEIRPLTPTHWMKPLLNYSYEDTISSMLPQQILSDTFTVELVQSDVVIYAQSGRAENWTNLSPGRKGSLISQSLWNPTAQLPKIYTDTFSSSETVRLEFDFKSVVVEKGDGNFGITVHAADSKLVSMQFDDTSSYTGSNYAYGVKMDLRSTSVSDGSSYYVNFLVGASSSYTIFVCLALVFSFSGL
uniref:CUB_2 domain-containing protein n=1 Tax=Caenorhabditis tropicalis TaxID=1561998 RepID=A0A1I7U9K1_9PELO